MYVTFEIAIYDNMKTYLTLFFLTVIVFFSHSQSVVSEWEVSYGSTGDDLGLDICTDPSNNVLITGRFEDTVYFASNGDTIISNGAKDLIIHKINSNSNILWTKTIGSNLDEQGEAIATDSFGNVYVAGQFRTTLDFDPGPSIFNMTPTAIINVFILKLDINGNFLWAKQIAGSNNVIHDLCIDKSNNVYLTGRYSGSIDSDPSNNTFTLQSMGLDDAYLIKLDVDGNFVWANSIGGGGFDVSQSVCTDNMNNVVVGGSFENTVDFDPGLGSTSLSSAGLRDFFVLQLDSSGLFNWVRTSGGNAFDHLIGLDVDTSGNIYSTGFFEGTVNFNSGTNNSILTSNGNKDVFLEKIMNDGSFSWVKSVGGSEQDEGLSVAVNSFDEIFLTGRFKSFDCDFDPSPDVLQFSSFGGDDIFVQRYDNSGVMHSTYAIGDVGSQWGISLTDSENGEMYLTGFFIGSCDFSPQSTSNYLTSNGNSDIFIQKIYSCELDTTITALGLDLHSNESNGSYQWLDCNNGFAPISNATSQSFTPSSNGEYAVEITQNSCIDTSMCYSVSNIGINELWKKTFSIYPNPTTNNQTLEIKNVPKNKVTIHLYDFSGKLITQISTEELDQDNLKITLPTASLTDGVYVYQIEIDEYLGYYKFVKQ